MPTRLQALGEKLYPQIVLMQPERAGKITGMLLELDTADIDHLICTPAALQEKVDEAVLLLKRKEELAKKVTQPPSNHPLSVSPKFLQTEQPEKDHKSHVSRTPSPRCVSHDCELCRR